MIEVKIDLKRFENRMDKWRLLRSRVDRGTLRVARQVQADFQATVSTWKHQPRFGISPISDGYAVLTQDKIYGWVELGTPPHRIVARRAKMLRFNASFVSKTWPGVLGSGPGGSGPPIVMVRGVNHPGTRARKFREIIVRLREPEAVKEIEREINELMRE